MDACILEPAHYSGSGRDGGRRIRHDSKQYANSVFGELASMHFHERRIRHDSKQCLERPFWFFIAILVLGLQSHNVCASC